MSYDVRAVPEVSGDLQTLRDQQEEVPEDWRLTDDEVEAAIGRAIEVIDSLRANPYQGELMRGEEKVLEGCRRIKFDPSDPPPVDHRGAPRPRMRVAWANEPDESSIALTRVLAVTHRWDSRPYKRAAERLGRIRRGGR